MNNFFTIGHSRKNSLIVFAVLFMVSMPTGSIAQDQNQSFTLPIESLSALTTRPLFSPSRQSAPITMPEAANTQNDDSPPLDGVLIGIATSDDGTGLALIRLNNAAEPMKVKLGEVVFGWQLSTIEDHKAIFVKNGQTISLTFP